MLRLLLLTASLSGCSVLPPFPEVVQYGVFADVNPPGFYGVDSKTKAQFYKSFSDLQMKAAQCLPAADYKASEAWVASVKLIAERHCTCIP